MRYMLLYSIVLIRKLRYRKVKKLIQGHTANKQLNWDLKPEFGFRAHALNH